MGGKITISLKELDLKEKHAHRKRARSTLSREGTLELRQ
jgi:hypothetical protein